ncbi:DNA-binding NarL/FixJ family response regulator [Bradyrhizobium sp. LM4.3]
MLVHVLADTSDKLFGLCSVLERQFTVEGERLDVEAKLPHAPAAVVIRADLRSVENIAALKTRAARLAKAGKRIFLVEQTSRVCISQAYALGATLVLPGKIDPIKLMAARCPIRRGAKLVRRATSRSLMMRSRLRPTPSHRCSL